MNEYELKAKNNIIKISIKRKKIKNVYLKVFRDLSVKLSVPINETDDWIIKYLNNKKDWIEEQVIKYKNTYGHNSLDEIKNGTSIQFLGKDMRIKKIKHNCNCVKTDEKNIYLYLTKLDNDKLARNTFMKWWKEQAISIFKEEVTLLYNDIFKKYRIKKPEVYIRRMKTLWGSCSVAKNKVTFNEYLIKANIRCIRYVILHELTHLKYPYHNDSFYKFLLIQMPDWEKRKKQLDKETVQLL